MQHMNICSSYETLSQHASDSLLAHIENKPNAVICLATGATPQLTYRYLVEKIHQRRTDISQITVVKLDEWLGLPLQKPGTCEHFLQQQVIQPLGLRDDQFIGFRTEDINEAECLRVVQEITQRGGLDLCVLGLGKNGHLGLNEPAMTLEPYCHISKLDEKTRRHDMIHQAGKPVEYGVTLGLKEVMSAREILMLIAGAAKHDAVASFMTKKVSTQTPASLLWLHNNLTCLLDGGVYQAVGR